MNNEQVAQRDEQANIELVDYQLNTALCPQCGNPLRFIFNRTGGVDACLNCNYMATPDHDCRNQDNGRCADGVKQEK